MSAVSKKVTPASSAAPTTSAVARRSRRRPKLLQPSPTTETSRSERPSLLASTTRSYVPRLSAGGGALEHVIATGEEASTVIASARTSRDTDGVAATARVRQRRG